MFENYFKFFGNHIFQRKEENLVRFYEDGSFSLYEGENLKLYSKDCKLIKSFCSPCLRFENGCIGIVSQQEDCIDIYVNGEFAYSFKLEYPHHRYQVSGNFLFLYDYNNHLDYYRITKQHAKKCQYSIIDHLKNKYDYRCYKGFKTAGDWLTIFFMGRDTDRYAFLISPQDTDVTYDNMTNFRGLIDSSYIIKTLNGSTLYNSKFEKILTSRKPEGIIPLGYGHVLYESALIAETETGLFVKEYEGEQAISEGGVSIFPYKFVKDDNKLFWHGGNFQFFKIEDKFLFVTYYDGKLYPIFIDEKIDEDLFLNKEIPTDYATRLSSMSYVYHICRIHSPVM